MGKRKDYSLDAARKRAPNVPIPTPANWVVRVADAEYDLARWRHHFSSNAHAGRDELVEAFCDALRRMCRTLSPMSIRSICRGAVPLWFEYVDARIDSGARSIKRLSDIDRECLEEFATWLRFRQTRRTASGRHSYTGARTIYTQIKSIWLDCIAVGVLGRDCIPDNPFPNSNRAMQSPKPYSKHEMSRLLAALASDLQLIREGRFGYGQSDRLMVYILFIAARTGRNQTPLFEMRRDALQPHPIKPETHALLTTYKRRGNNISVQSLKVRSKQIEDAATISSDVAALICQVRDVTKDLAMAAPAKISNLLWLFESQRGKGKILSINATNYHDIIERFVVRHGLTSDDVDPKTGKPKELQLTFMRLRKTFASRMWELTGGDLVRTAHALGNQPRVTDTHYLAVTPEMTRNHRFVGMCLEADLRGEIDNPDTIARLANEMGVALDEAQRIIQGKNNTGVGRCSSPHFGKFAPQTGERACTAFLHCFRCPNQVIMESDLHRLFSFYWLLIKERNILSRNRWHKVYGWVIREIDQVICSRFDHQIVDKVREEARMKPHPMWRDRAMLGGGLD